jgi:hypothetical protein
VQDAERVRAALVPKSSNDGRWTVLGQSFGGFCALTYLSMAPQGGSGMEDGVDGAGRWGCAALGRARPWGGRGPGAGAALGRARPWSGRGPGAGAALGQPRPWGRRGPGAGAAAGRLRADIPVNGAAG